MVSFLDQNSIHVIESRDSYTKLERMRSWYTPSEINNMKIRSEKNAQHALHNNNNNGIYDHSQVSRMICKEDEQCRVVVSNVLKHQKQLTKNRQRRRGGNRPAEDELALKYSNMSMKYRKAAFIYGNFDAVTAAKIYREDGMLPPVKSRKTTSRPSPRHRVVVPSNYMNVPKVQLPTALIR